MNTHDTTPQAASETAAQLRDLERQGGGMARLAHVSAGLLLVAFSAGSLVSISHAAFVSFLAAWSAGQADIPDGISLVVNLLLVLAADVALLYAASVLRVLTAAQAPAEERRVHVWAMIGASALESSTYLYLAWQFDRPATFFLWSLVLARALGAPLFAAYLSMARPLPVAPRDVAYQAALASGKGVVRDVATLAADSSAPLRRKVRIYTAASLMTRNDRTRFDDIIEAVSEDATTPLAGAGGAQHGQAGIGMPAHFEATGEPHTATPEPILDGSPETPDRLPMPTQPHRPPTGPGSPSVASKPTRQSVAAAASVASKVTPLRSPGSTRPARQTRRVAARANARSGKRGTAEQKIRALLATEPGIAFDELVKRAKVSESTASKWQAVVQAERAHATRASVASVANVTSSTTPQGGQYAQ